VTDQITIWAALLAVKSDSGIVWGRFDRQKPHFGTPEWAIIISASLLIVVVMCISRWRERRRKAVFLCHSNSALFNELAHAHRLNRADRKWIKRIAAAHGQKNPAAMFVQPEHFEDPKTAGSENVLPGVLRQLRHELFE
jgi:hypothetical protein